MAHPLPRPAPLQSGTYGDIYNFPQQQYEAALAQEEVPDEEREAAEAAEEEEAEIEEYVEGDEEDEEEDEVRGGGGEVWPRCKSSQRIWPGSCLFRRRLGGNTRKRITVVAGTYCCRRCCCLPCRLVASSLPRLAGC